MPIGTDLCKSTHSSLEGSVSNDNPTCTSNWLTHGPRTYTSLKPKTGRARRRAMWPLIHTNGIFKAIGKRQKPNSSTLLHVVAGEEVDVTTSEGIPPGPLIWAIPPSIRIWTMGSCSSNGFRSQGAPTYYSLDKSGTVDEHM